MKFKKKKVTRLRGSKTHGWGAMKKHRGAGNRGGRGMAGSGKRGDAKKSLINKNTKYFGKYGFKSIKKIGTRTPKKINIDTLEEKLPQLLERKQAEKKGSVIIIDLKKIGYHKLLGTGEVKNKFEISVDFASKKAVEKIQAKGGKVNVLVIKKEKPKKEKKLEKEVEKKKSESEEGVEKNNKNEEDNVVKEEKQDPEDLSEAESKK
jgi:large subunit ribosomal protein L15